MLSDLSFLDSWVFGIFSPWLLGLGVNTLLAAIAWFTPKKFLTPAGLVHAWALGIILWGTLGWRGYAVMLIYFILGSAVTRIGMAEKEAAGIAEERSGARGPGNVWGSALTATLCALGYYTVTTNPTSLLIQSLALLLLLGYVASISTKLSDTFATEIGKAYGQRTFLITTFQPVPRGTEGAISLEGTLAGIVGSAAIALVGWALQFITPIGIAWCMIAAFIATTLESVIGATLENKWPWLTHDVVNVLNTFIGAIAAILIAFIVAQTTGTF
jgi:uncharacterized protein (TIGR00297 family)